MSGEYLIILKQNSFRLLHPVECDDDVETRSLQIVRRGCALDRVEERKDLPTANEGGNSGGKRKRRQVEQRRIGCRESRMWRGKTEPTISRVRLLEVGGKFSRGIETNVLRVLSAIHSFQFR